MIKASNLIEVRLPHLQGPREYMLTSSINLNFTSISFKHLYATTREIGKFLYHGRQNVFRMGLRLDSMTTLPYSTTRKTIELHCTIYASFCKTENSFHPILPTFYASFVVLAGFSESARMKSSSPSNRFLSWDLIRFPASLS